MNMESWDIKFEDALNRLSESDKHKAGIILPIVPKRADCEEFKNCCKSAWPEWHYKLADHKYCLMVLFNQTYHEQLDRKGVVEFLSD